MVWPEEKLMMYNFYDEMNSINTIDHLEGKSYIVKNGLWKRLILIWDNDASFHLSMTVLKYINTQKDWLTIIHLPKNAPYLNPNERKVNEKVNQMCVLIDSKKIRKLQYLNIWISNLEDGGNGGLFYDT